jgi:hypothetical protein
LRSFDYNRKSFDYFLSNFSDQIEDEFVVGHELGRELPIEINVEPITDTRDWKRVQRNLKFGKKKQRAVEFVLTEKKLIIAFHEKDSWAASEKRKVEKVENILLTINQEIWPRLTGVYIERGPLLGSSCRLMLLIEDKENAGNRPIGFILEDNWLPGLLQSIVK